MSGNFWLFFPFLSSMPALKHVKLTYLLTLFMIILINHIQIWNSEIDRNSFLPQRQWERQLLHTRPCLWQRTLMFFQATQIVWLRAPLTCGGLSMMEACSCCFHSCSASTRYKIEKCLWPFSLMTGFQTHTVAFFRCGKSVRCGSLLWHSWMITAFRWRRIYRVSCISSALMLKWRWWRW